MGTEPGRRSGDGGATRGSPARVFIADDHALLRSGMRAMLASEPDIEVVGEAEDGRQEVELCRELLPDLVLMDVGMPDMDGMEATRRIKAEHPAISVLVVTAHPSPDYMLDAVRAGAAGYLLKTASRAEIFDAVRSVLRNELPLDRQLTAHLIQRLAQEAAPQGASAGPIERRRTGSPDALTNREEVLLGAMDVPVRLSRSATDAEGEVTASELQRSTDGGPYEDVALAGATETTGTFQLEPGHDHRFRVRATDDNGNRSIWKYGPRFALDVPQEDDPSVSYARTWKTQTIAGASGGGVRYATARGAEATLSFTGSEVAWVAPKSKTRGKAAVYLDGAKVTTVDLFSRQTLARQVVFSKGNLDPATPHTLEVRNLGTAGRSRVDVDAFAVLR